MMLVGIVDVVDLMSIDLSIRERVFAFQSSTLVETISKISYIALGENQRDSKVLFSGDHF